MNRDLDTRQSVVFDALRFPLIVIVLYMHIVPLEHFDFLQSGVEASMNAYYFIAELVAHNFGRMAVPCFFLISGYFYFRKMEEWSGGFYLKQQRKRFFTLLIPYLLWNVLNILVILGKGCLFNLVGRNGSADLGYIYGTSLWELMISPVNQPLWYLRDLICMTIIAPLFYYLFRYGRVWGLVVLLLLYLSCMELPIRGFSMTAVFYFGVGAYWGILKRNFLEDARQVRWWSIGLAPILVLLATFNNSSPYYEHLIRLFVPVGILAVVNLTDMLIWAYPKVREYLLSLSGSVFFIYAVHELYLKNWVKGAFYRTPLADSGVGMILGYILMPLVLLGICMVLYYVMRRIAPRVLSVLVGGR